MIATEIDSAGNTAPHGFLKPSFSLANLAIGPTGFVDDLVRVMHNLVRWINPFEG
jgi:hypothetical protein